MSSAPLPACPAGTPVPEVYLLSKERSINAFAAGTTPANAVVHRRELEEREIKVSREDFNVDNMLTTLRQYYNGGRFDFLLNSKENIDLLSKRFIVFEIDQIKGAPVKAA